jgi:ribose transport system ATP-binding protein
VTGPVLQLHQIVKTYPGVAALNGVSFEVQPAEVHALVGENGAGKSTLIGVAAGATAPDSGTVHIGGQPLPQPLPAAAAALGLAVVYQHPTVLDDLTVTENMLLSLPAGRRPPVARAAGWTRRHLELVGADVSPAARVEELSVAQRQLVEIARALALDARVLILDEPTESLTAAESERLFEQVARLRAAGAGIVYISHRFPEVRRVADRITVLRDGEARGTFAAGAVTEDDVLRLIIGRSVDRAFPPRGVVRPQETVPLLAAAGLSSSRFDGVDLAVHPGEIVGLAGVEGNGQRELLRALAGLLRARGEVTVDGRPVRLTGPAAAREAGLVYLPQDRHAEGAFLPRPVRENVSALVLDRLSRWGVVQRARETELARTEIAALDIRTPSTETTVDVLSGGNQQKVVFARSMAAQPRVLLADEPTRGVDVGARLEIYRLLRDFTGGGGAVVTASSDAVELNGLCDRVLVFSRGQVVRSLAGDELTEQAITGAAIGASTSRAGGAAGGRGGWRQRLGSGTLLPSGVLAVLVVLLAVWATSRNSLFLGHRNLTSLLLLASVLAFAAAGQLIVLLVASIDLSVGPLIGLVVVLLSFFATRGRGLGGLAVGVAVCVGVAVGVGLLNGLLVRLVRLPSVIATLVTFIALQGMSLLLRPHPAGFIDPTVTQWLRQRVSVVPVAAIAVLVVCLAGEWLLRRTAAGRELRAVGSDETRARRLGARVNGTVVVAHVLCSLLAVPAGIMLASVVGVGQASLGADYTLTSITAVVLGGASIFGGRGSFVGALLGALLIQEIVTATTFLGLAQAWQEWLPGLLILLGAGLYSRVRTRGTEPALAGALGGAGGG